MSVCQVWLDLLGNWLGFHGSPDPVASTGCCSCKFNITTYFLLPLRNHPHMISAIVKGNGANKKVFTIWGMGYKEAQYTP